MTEAERERFLKIIAELREELKWSPQELESLFEGGIDSIMTAVRLYHRGRRLIIEEVEQVFIRRMKEREDGRS